MRSFAERYPEVEWDANAKPKPIPWLADGFWLKGGINAVLGPEKTGKSRFIGWLLAQMLGAPQGGVILHNEHGTPWSGHSGFRKVLYLNAEEQSVDIMARVNAYARFLGIEPSDQWPITSVFAAGMQLQLARERADFEQAFLAKREYDLVILDPLRRVHAGEENSNSEMAALHNDLRRWTYQYSLTWTLVHHTGHLHEDDDLERIATWCRGNTDLPSLLDGATCLQTIGGTAECQTRKAKRIGRFPPMEDVVLLDHGDPVEGKSKAKVGFAVRL